MSMVEWNNQMYLTIRGDKGKCWGNNGDIGLGRGSCVDAKKNSQSDKSTKQLNWSAQWTHMSSLEDCCLLFGTLWKYIKSDDLIVSQTSESVALKVCVGSWVGSCVESQIRLKQLFSGTYSALKKRTFSLHCLALIGKVSINRPDYQCLLHMIWGWQVCPISTLFVCMEKDFCLWLWKEMQNFKFCLPTTRQSEGSKQWCGYFQQWIEESRKMSLVFVSACFLLAGLL